MHPRGVLPGAEDQARRAQGRGRIPARTPGGQGHCGRLVAGVGQGQPLPGDERGRGREDEGQAPGQRSGQDEVRDSPTAREERAEALVDHAVVRVHEHVAAVCRGRAGDVEIEVQGFAGAQGIGAAEDLGAVLVEGQIDLGAGVVEAVDGQGIGPGRIVVAQMRQVGQARGPRRRGAGQHDQDGNEQVIQAAHGFSRMFRWQAGRGVIEILTLDRRDAGGKSRGESRPRSKGLPPPSRSLPAEREVDPAGSTAKALPPVIAFTSPAI